MPIYTSIHVTVRTIQTDTNVCKNCFSMHNHGLIAPSSLVSSSLAMDALSRGHEFDSYPSRIFYDIQNLHVR